MTSSIRRALLLCAGRGVRLEHLTETRPKPMIELAGIPILERILLMLKHQGIEEAIIVHGYLGEVILQHFGSGEKLGIKLQFRQQTTLTGTAEAMLLAEDLLKDEPFLLHWGDIIVDPRNIAAVTDKFSQEAAKCVMNVTWVEDPWKGGAVYREGEKVLRTIEKPPIGTGHTHWIIGGVIAFDPCMWGYLHKTKKPEQGEYFITQAIDLMAQDGESVLAHETIGERIHISTPEDVAKLHDDPRLAAWLPQVDSDTKIPVPAQ